MGHNNYIFWGMHFAWWLVWFIAIIFLFILFFRFSGQMKSLKEKPLEILQKRFAAGQISRIEYLKDREIIMMTKVAKTE